MASTYVMELRILVWGWDKYAFFNGNQYMRRGCGAMCGAMFTCWGSHKPREACTEPVGRDQRRETQDDIVI